MFPIIYTDIYKKPTDYPSGGELGNVDYPNLNSTEYRQAPIDRTIKMQKVWEGITLNDENQAVIGTNKVTGREWYSTFWGFEKPLEKIEEKNSCFQVQRYALITQTEYVANNLLIVTFRNGCIQLWSTYPSKTKRDPNNPYCLLSVAKNYSNDSMDCLEVIKPANTAFTGSPDGTMMIWKWNESDMSCHRSYQYAHLNAITGITHKKSHTDLVATCSSDYSVHFWDLRKTRPSHTLYDQHDCSIKAIAWNDLNDNHIFIGDAAGSLHTIDSRYPKKLNSSTKLFDRAIRKIVCNGNNMAVIADNNIVKVFSIKEKEVIYENDSHQHFVRDCAWYDDKTLLTVGLDSKLRKHYIK